MFLSFQQGFTKKLTGGLDNLVLKSPITGGK